ncbi:glycoside hydrolase family 78 protein (bacterial alpha-L-rhamnosidase domain-containing protein) [Colletotrichum tofieldiae]|uniref:Glycoside hydrolase family 78 protein (Bacterial alpha-L-rhamnosidase domain-containing protein) n=1 Tax=Colletotrichum tofieldiae TaxID=708197 RepID=A0A166X9V0_9PEZI|nr:glycoside hydrolase family 78 protein (bacterial alpha-L-rhamnosidase domain-containing protein) [Colletotrichum tofieldiae]
MVSSKPLLVTFGLVASALAQSCWRNATCTHPTEASFPGPWDENIYAPDSRTARPKSVLSLSTGEPLAPFSSFSSTPPVLKGNGSALVFDFGVLVGGITTVNYTLVGGSATLGLAWTEAKNWIGESSDNSNGNYRGPGQALISDDGALFHDITAPGEGSYTVPFAQLRGGFRYLTVYLVANSTTADATLSVDDVSLEIVAPDTGILNATATGDWARYINSMNGSAPNMLLYRTLTTGAFLADLAPAGTSGPAAGTDLAGAWLSRAEALKAAIKTHLWDGAKGAFIDGHKNRTLYPQDSNSYAVAFGVVDPAGAEAASISRVLTENWTPIGPASPELPGNVSPFISSIELEAHFVAGRADRALRLIRDSWGWYLNHPNGTGSTVIEGYLVDGTFGYRSSRGYTDDPSYVSHAHGWSSGPTSTLTEYLVGLRVTRPAGAGWSLKPVFGEVPEAQAGFTTALGRFSARWKVEGGVAAVEWDVPSGTRGWVELGGEEGRWVDGGKGTASVRVKAACGSRPKTRET